MTIPLATKHQSCMVRYELLEFKINEESEGLQVNIPFIVTLIGLLTGAGAADHLIAYRHKTKLHDLAVRFWMRLYDTPIQDLPKLLAHWVVTRTERILNTKWKAFLGYLIVCTLFLTFVYSLSDSGYIPKGQTVVLPLSAAEKALKPDLFDSSPLPHVAIIATVVAFDMLTFFLTLSFLRGIRNADRSFAVITFLGHASTLFFITTTCLASVTYVGTELFNHNAVGVRYQKQTATLSRIEAFNYFASKSTNFNLGRQLSTNAVVVSCNIQHSFVSDWNDNYKAIFSILTRKRASCVLSMRTIFNDNGVFKIWDCGYEEYVPVSGLFTVGTLVFPAILIMLLLVFLVIAKILLSLVRNSSLYLIDLATEKPPEGFKPFFLLACSADVLILLLKLTGEILTKLKH